MAVGGKQSKLDGWQHQADRLARRHAAVPALPRTATAQTPRHRLPQPALRSVPPADEDRRPDQHVAVERCRGQAANPPAKDFSREEALDWILKARKEALAVRADTATAAKARIAEFEASLEAALARVTYLGDENQSLQTALDMAADENLDLGRHLAESETRCDEACAELQSAAVLRAEYDMAASEAEKKVELLQNTITVRNARLQKLEQARRKMERDTSKLLETAKVRDQALADAEQRILELTQLFEKLELSLEARNGENDNQARNPKPGAGERADLEQAGRELRLWRRELDTDDWLLGRPAKA
jgi:chromosome segregation ATPase